MAGETTRSSSWLHSLGVPAILVAIEATWVSAWLGQASHLGHRASDVPFAAVALPALAAVLLGAAAGTLKRRARRVALAAGGAVGVVLSAGLIAAGAGWGGWATTSFHPWDATGLGAAGAKLAWFLALVAWARGLWLGSRGEVDATSASWSIGLAALALVLFLLVAAVTKGAWHHQGGRTALLLLLVFPGAGAVLALVHERDLERAHLRRAAGRPSGAWLAALGLPMATVAVLAVGLALLVGPVAPIVGHGLVDAARGVGDGLRAAFHWIGNLFHLKASGQRPLKAPRRPFAKIPRDKGNSILQWLLVAVVGAAVAVGLAVNVFLLVRYILERLRSRRRPTATPDPNREVESVFSWGHFLRQLLALLRRRLRVGRWRRAAQAADSEGPEAGADLLAPESVRAHYRQLLRGARVAGLGRQAAETPLELERRLGPLAGADGALARLTDRYDRVRYGRGAEGTDQVDEAALLASAALTALSRAVAADAEADEGGQA